MKSNDFSSSGMSTFPKMEKQPNSLANIPLNEKSVEMACEKEGEA